MPVSALLARIRKLIPRQNDAHYDEIVRSIDAGALRPRPSPMTAAITGTRSFIMVISRQRF